MIGTAWELAPGSTPSATPVTVTLKYDPAKLPVWALPSDLALYHFTGGQWVKLPDLAVDEAAHTVSGRTTSFSPFTIGTRLPQGALTRPVISGCSTGVSAPSPPVPPGASVETPIHRV